MAENNNNSPMFFPQAMLVYKKVYNAKAGDKLKESSVGENGNKFVSVAKLKGDYQPEVVVSKLVNTDGITVDNNLLNLENHKISALVPEVRLYRILEGQENAIVPFYFPVAAEHNFDDEGKLNLAESSFSAGAAVIESFSFSLAGANPYQISRKFLNASLSIKVDNLSVLFDKKDGYAMLADLFTIRAGAAKNTFFAGSGKGFAGDSLASKQSCRIVATLGYSAPRDYTMFSSEEITTIEQSKQIVNLYYSAHDLQVAQDGATTVSIKYTGYLESIKEDGKYDLLSDHNAKATSSTRESRTDKATKNIKKALGKTAEKKEPKTEKEEEKRKKKTQQDTADAFYKIVNDLYVREKIYSTGFDPLYYQALDTESNTASTASTVTRQKKAQIDESDPFKNHTIHYFNFGDLLESYFKKIGNDLNAAKTKKKKDLDTAPDKSKIQASIKNLDDAKRNLGLINVLLCDVNLKRSKETTTGIYHYENIADVPISLDNFYTKVWKEIRKTTTSFYDMNSFLRDFCLELLNQSLDHFPSAPLLEDVTYVLTPYTSLSLKNKINRGVINIEDTEKSVQSFTKGSIKNLSEYLVFHQAPAQYSRSPGSGTKKRDTEIGMFHLRPNKDRGFLKTISFSKISQPAREASLVAGNSDLYDELRIPHNADVAMYGNFMFLPGSQVYIDPNTLGFGSVRDKDSAARRLGFGGYYTVQTVSTNFSGGRLETTLSLLFNAFPETESEPSLSARANKSIKEMQGIMGSK
jgi:hypothetical protein